MNCVMCHTLYAWLLSIAKNDVNVCGFSRQFFVCFCHKIVCFVVAIRDPVHNVEIIPWLCYLLTASGNLFLKYETCQKNCIISLASFIFQKLFHPVSC